MKQTVVAGGGGEGKKPGRVDRAGSLSLSARGWSLVGWLGAGLALVGGLDLLLTWIPLNFGDVEWEFGTVTATFNGLPVLALGLGLSLGSAVARDRRRTTLLFSVLFVLLAVLVLGAAIIYATTVPMALGAVGDGGIRTGLMKAVVKAAGQSVIYPTLFLIVGVIGIRTARSGVMSR